MNVDAEETAVAERPGQDKDMFGNARTGVQATPGLVSDGEKALLARTIVELIRENSEVRSAVLRLVCACPNIVTQI
jgi:hypothetical protein